MTEPVRLRDAAELATVTTTVVRAVRTEVLGLVPGADVIHTGSRARGHACGTSLRSWRSSTG
jgi:hypothetical protein